MGGLILVKISEKYWGFCPNLPTSRQLSQILSESADEKIYSFILVLCFW